MKQTDDHILDSGKEFDPFSQDTGPGEKGNQEAEEARLDSAVGISAWIKQSIDELKSGDDILSVTFDLPPVSRVDPDHLITALDSVLIEYGIRLPAEFGRKLKAGEYGEFHFVSPAREKHLQPRDIELNTLPEISTMIIHGVPPREGERGFCRIYYEFSKKPGRFLPDGTIDFRQINRFPQVEPGTHILRLYLPTKGVQGTDVFGLPIEPPPGEPFPIEIEGEFQEETGHDPDTGREYIDYFSEKHGIIRAEFQGEPCEENIRSLSIQKEIILKNVDFSTGNLAGDGDEIRCAADVIVEGDIRGQFAVVIDGRLEVKGAVEGTTVDATGPVVANFVKNFLRTRSFMEVGSARQARLISGEHIIVRKEISDAELNASEVILDPKGTATVMCGRCKITANRISGSGITVRNQMVVKLGDPIFQQRELVLRNQMGLMQEMEQTGASLKDRAASYGQKLKMAYNLYPETERGILHILKQLGAMLLLGKLSPEKMKKKLNLFAKEHGQRFQSLLKQLFHILAIKEEQERLQRQIQEIEQQLKEIEQEMQGIEFQINGVIGGAGKIILDCYGKRKVWEPPEGSPLASINIHLRFSIDDYQLQEI